MDGAYIPSPVDLLASIKDHWPVLTQQINFFISILENEKDLVMVGVAPNIITHNFDKGFTIICNVGESDQAPSKSLYAMMIQIYFDNQGITTKIHKNNFSEDYFLAISIKPE